MDGKGGHIDFMFLGHSPTRPVDPLLNIDLRDVYQYSYIPKFLLENK